MSGGKTVRISITDNDEVELPSGSTPAEAFDAAGIDAPGLVAAVFDGDVVELNRPLEADGALQLLTFEDPRGREASRHTASHVMAQAVKRLFPNGRLGMGPAIEDGFYYDFGLDRALRPEDLALIEEEMRSVISADYPVIRRTMPMEDAVRFFRERGEDYKLEMLEDLPGDVITVYEQGEFADLCRGPHLAGTGDVSAFKLLSVAGAYWRGDERREMLQRIYGTAFDSEEALEAYLEARREAEKRDHRKLGAELELFSIREEIGPGLVVYHPNGAVLRTVIEDYLKAVHAGRGYQMVISPHIMRKDIWETSGHLQMQYPMYYFEIEGQGYGIKPMNCPAHISVYKSRTRGHNELPLRLFELGTVYRHERSGVLHGLLRVRGFTQDDAHIFCTMEQAEHEIDDAIRFAFETQRAFGFSSFRIALSTRPDNYVGSEEDWGRATELLRNALEANGLQFIVDEGEGVFYGPKIDVKLEDALGRWWQGPTIQFDFNLPRRFGMSYVGADNEEHVPVMIHRTVLGSLERYMGILIEHYAGAFPLWLAPVQVEVLPIADRHVPYARTTGERLQRAGVRVKLNDSRETVSSKIRGAWKAKVPYAVIIGDREAGEETVSVRSLSGRDERGVALETFIDGLLEERVARP